MRACMSAFRQSSFPTLETFFRNAPLENVQLSVFYGIHAQMLFTLFESKGEKKSQLRPLVYSACQNAHQKSSTWWVERTISLEINVNMYMNTKQYLDDQRPYSFVIPMVHVQQYLVVLVLLILLTAFVAAIVWHEVRHGNGSNSDEFKALIGFAQWKEK